MKKALLLVVFLLALAGPARAGITFGLAGASSTPFTALYTLTNLGATISIPSDVSDILIYGSLDQGGTILIHASFTSMADAAADGAMETGWQLSGVGAATNAVIYPPIWLQNLRLYGAVTLYLWTPAASKAMTHVVYRKRRTT